MSKRELMTVGNEANLAVRVATERKRRGWSYEDLAQKMTEAGCATGKAAMWKLENGNGEGRPPRQISVNELIAFSAVFDLTIKELLTPLDEVERIKAERLMNLCIVGLDNLYLGAVQLHAAIALAARLGSENPEVGEFVARQLPTRAKRYFASPADIQRLVDEAEEGATGSGQVAKLRYLQPVVSSMVSEIISHAPAAPEAG